MFSSGGHGSAIAQSGTPIPSAKTANAVAAVRRRPKEREGEASMTEAEHSDIHFSGQEK